MKKSQGRGWSFLVTVAMVVGAMVICRLITMAGVEESEFSQPEAVWPEISWNELVLGNAVAGNVIIAQTGPDTLTLSGGLNKNIVLLEENAAYFEIIHLGDEDEWRLYFYRTGGVIFWGLEKSRDSALNL